MEQATLSALDLDQALEASAAQHQRLCPRQVLGVRIGRTGLAALGMVPGASPGLVTFIEMDGCFADGVVAATGCTVGHRTLRVQDYGKVAATFIDARDGRGVRIVPRADIRERAFLHAPGESRRYYAQLWGYQRMPDAELLDIRPVRLVADLAGVLGPPPGRTRCDACGEEVLVGHEVTTAAGISCLACATAPYYVTEFSAGRGRPVEPPITGERLL